MDFNKALPTPELGEILYDCYKAVFGVRPRHIDFSSREAIIQGLTSCEIHFNRECETKEGRNRLRDEGWVIAVPSPEDDRWIDPYAEEAAW